MPIKAMVVRPGASPPCQGFTIEIRILIPKKGYKLHVLVDKTCVNDQARWGLTFTLEKKIGNEYVEIVFVSYKPKADDTPAQRGIEKTLQTRLTKQQIKIGNAEVFPVTAELEGTPGPTPDQKKRLEAASRKLAVA